MAKLYFRYGTVSSGKTLSLLNIYFSYRAQNRCVLLLKPDIDIRFGEQIVKSRSGLAAACDFLLSDASNLEFLSQKHVDLILVDEAQFLQVKSIDALRSYSIQCNTPVICFGLRTDFRSELFEGSKRLFEVADQCEEIKSICQFCLSKAVFNLRYRNGRAEFSGDVVELGENDLYYPVCPEHYAKLKKFPENIGKELSLRTTELKEKRQVFL